tara:strand:+ start:360 stop:635 length:276 start_codon:yes stop_codon:yes gene_type:complete
MAARTDHGRQCVSRTQPVSYVTIDVSTQGHNMARTPTCSFEFYNHNERMEVLTALNHYQQRLTSDGLEPTNVRAEVLNRLIDDFQEFTLAN